MSFHKHQSSKTNVLDIFFKDRNISLIFQTETFAQCTYNPNNQRFNKNKKLNQAIKRLKRHLSQFFSLTVFVTTMQHI